jgi:hypothetical protein
MVNKHISQQLIYCLKSNLKITTLAKTQTLRTMRSRSPNEEGLILRGTVKETIRMMMKSMMMKLRVPSMMAWSLLKEAG